MSDIVERLTANLDKYPGFQNMNSEAAAEITRLRARLAAWKAEAEAWRLWFDEEGGRFNDGCGCCSRETVTDSVYGNKNLMAARAATDAIEKEKANGN